MLTALACLVFGTFGFVAGALYEQLRKHGSWDAHQRNLALLRENAHLTAELSRPGADVIELHNFRGEAS